MASFNSGKLTTIFDINGIPRIIREVSVNNFLVLKELYSVYWNLILELDPFMESNFFELIENDERVKKTAIEIIKLVGLKPKWIGTDTLAALIHSYVDQEGKPQKGFLWSHYFERKTNNQNNENSLSLEEYRMFLIAALTEQEGGIGKVLPLLDQMSISELEAYFVQKKRLNDQSKLPTNQDKFRKLKDKYRQKFGDTEFKGVTIEQTKNT